MGRLALVVGRRPALDGGVARPRDAAQREAAAGANRLDARLLAEPALDRLEPPIASGRVRITGLRQRHRERDRMVRVEAGIDVLQPPEAAHEQYSADDEHDRQRHLARDEQIAEHARSARCRFAAFGRLPASRRRQRRHDAEQDRRRNRERNREERHRTIELHVGEERDRRGRVARQRSSCQRRQSKSKCAADS